jgi:hypothetical protein
MPRNNGVKLSKSTARRLIDAGRYVEQQPRSVAPALDGPVHFGGAVMLYTTTQLTRMSGATPGTGMGKIQQFNGTSYSDLSATQYPILNDTNALVAASSYVLCVPGPGGKYHWVMTNCANIS